MPAHRVWLIQLAICLTFALALRAPSFGDPNIHVDEAFYWFVGQEMHNGALLYVDIWDRKPLGLFLIYYIISGVSRSVYAYQIIAWLFASATAFVIVRIAALWTGAQGSILAGLSYLALMLPLLGVGGQAPVFYNLPIALAAWAIFTSIPFLGDRIVPIRVYVAMLLCGLSLTIKQTTLFESLFFGSYAMALLYRAKGPAIRFAFLACILGAAPTLIIGAYYAVVGHWFEFWQAIVVSNLLKGHSPWMAIFFRMVRIAVILALIIPPAFLGIVLSRGDARLAPYRRFLHGWLLAALVGFLSVPNAYNHYVLPLSVPLCIASAHFYARPWVGPAVFGLMVGYCILDSEELDPQRHADSAMRMQHLADTIRHHNRGRLLVFDGPPALYTLSGAPFMSPLVFPHHLNHLIERDVSQFNTAREIRRIIATHPSVVVMSTKPRNEPVNVDSEMTVWLYVINHCQLLDGQFVPEYKRIDGVLVYGACH